MPPTDKTFQCTFQLPSGDLCLKTFTRKQRLKEHMQGHLGTKPFICSVCGRGASRRDDLEKHMRIHTGEKPYHCSYPDCGKAFSDSSTLASHNKWHKGERPWLCDICDKRFIEKSTLVMHMKTVHLREEDWDEETKARLQKKKQTMKKWREKQREKQANADGKQSGDSIPQQQQQQGKNPIFKASSSISSSMVSRQQLKTEHLMPAVQLKTEHIMPTVYPQGDLPPAHHRGHHHDRGTPAGSAAIRYLDEAGGSYNGIVSGGASMPAGHNLEPEMQLHFSNGTTSQYQDDGPEYTPYTNTST